MKNQAALPSPPASARSFQTPRNLPLSLPILYRNVLSGPIHEVEQGRAFRIDSDLGVL